MLAARESLFVIAILQSTRLPAFSIAFVIIYYIYNKYMDK
jgi:hypothetical protein